MSRYQKSKTNLDITEARDSEWQWHQLGQMQVCTLFQTDNHASTPPSFFQARCPSCRPTNSIKALTEITKKYIPGKKIKLQQNISPPRLHFVKSWWANHLVRVSRL